MSSGSKKEEGGAEHSPTTPGRCGCAEGGNGQELGIGHAVSSFSSTQECPLILEPLKQKKGNWKNGKGEEFQESFADGIKSKNCFRIRAVAPQMICFPY